ncbi:MAG: NDP-sugar synthase [Thermodesulfobacteriota bacterium]
MILAAGLGTRLRPFSNRRPKPLFPLLGKPLVLHILKQLRSHGVTSVIINAHHLSAQFRSLLTVEKDVYLQVEDDILGTGGGMRMASRHMGKKPVLVVNGDIFHSIDLTDIYQKHLASGAPVSLVVHNRPRFNNLRVSSTGRISGMRVSEGSVDSETGERLMAFAGIHVIAPGILKNIPSGCFYDIIDFYRKLIGDDAVINAIEASGHFWSDMGTPEDYLDLHRALLTDKSLPLPAGFSRPDGSFFRPDDVDVGPLVEFKDWVSIGAGVIIGAGAKISRSVVWDGVVVNAGEVLEDEIIVE